MANQISLPNVGALLIQNLRLNETALIKVRNHFLKDKNIFKNYQNRIQSFCT